MPRAKNDAARPLETIWEVPDALWERFEPILLKHYPPARTGRPRVDLRRVIDGVIFRMRSGCQWNRLPEEYPDDSSVHRTFQRWAALGAFERIWAALVAACDELAGVEWEWQAADAALGKARFGGMPSGRTPRIAPSAA